MAAIFVRTDSLLAGSAPNRASLATRKEWDIDDWRVEGASDDAFDDAVEQLRTVVGCEEVPSELDGSSSLHSFGNESVTVAAK